MVHGVNSIVPIDIYGHAVFERNAIVRLFLDVGSHMNSCQSLLLSIIVLIANDLGYYIASVNR